MSRVLALLLLAAAAAPAAAVTDHDMLMRELTTGALDAVAAAAEQVERKASAFQFAFATRAGPQPGRALLMDMDTCVQSASCFTQLGNAFENYNSWSTITSRSLCPIAPGFADRCFYVRAALCAR